MLTCRFENGSQTDRLRHATVTAIVTGPNGILLVKRSPDLLGGGQFGLPGGYMEANERIFDAARREVFEETGYETHYPVLFIINDHPARLQEDRQNLDFVVILQSGNKSGTPDWESIETGWFSLDMVPAANRWAFDHYQTFLRYCRFLQAAEPLPITNFDYEP